MMDDEVRHMLVSRELTLASSLQQQYAPLKLTASTATVRATRALVLSTATARATQALVLSTATARATQALVLTTATARATQALVSLKQPYAPLKLASFVLQCMMVNFASDDHHVLTYKVQAAG